MLFVTQPHYRPIALCIGILLIIWKRCIDRYFLLPYQVPVHSIHSAKEIARKSMRGVIIFAVSVTPLQLVLQIDRPNLIVVLDDSLSMQSTDTDPTRLKAWLRLAHGIHSIGSFEHCYSLVSQIQLPCNKYTTLQKSGTSITDLVLLAVFDYPQKTILVISDNGANNGIKTSQLNQELQKIAKKDLMRTDIQPNTQELVISWAKLNTLPSEVNIITKSKYFRAASTDNSTIDKLANQQKNILLQQENSRNLPLNYVILLCALILAALMSMQHFMEHLTIHRQTKKK